MPAFLSSRTNWIPPTPSPPIGSCCSASFWIEGGGTHPPLGRGWGDPIPTKEQTLLDSKVNQRDKRANSKFNLFEQRNMSLSRLRIIDMASFHWFFVFILLKKVHVGYSRKLCTERAAKARQENCRHFINNSSQYFTFSGDLFCMKLDLFTSFYTWKYQVSSSPPPSNSTVRVLQFYDFFSIISERFSPSIRLIFIGTNTSFNMFFLNLLWTYI